MRTKLVLADSTPEKPTKKYPFVSLWCFNSALSEHYRCCFLQSPTFSTRLAPSADFYDEYAISRPRLGIICLWLCIQCWDSYGAIGGMPRQIILSLTKEVISTMVVEAEVECACWLCDLMQYRRSEWQWRKMKSIEYHLKKSVGCPLELWWILEWWTTEFNVCRQAIGFPKGLHPESNHGSSRWSAWTQNSHPDPAKYLAALDIGFGFHSSFLSNAYAYMYVL